MKNKNKYRVNDILSKIRFEKGYSQEYMAHTLGVSQANYSKLENGQIKLSFDIIVDLCVILGISLEDMLNQSFPEMGEIFKNPKLREMERNTNMRHINNSLKQSNLILENMIYFSENMINLLLKKSGKQKPLG